jgi:hypothetical protein
VCAVAVRETLSPARQLQRRPWLNDALCFSPASHNCAGFAFEKLMRQGVWASARSGKPFVTRRGRSNLQVQLAIQESIMNTNALRDDLSTEAIESAHSQGSGKAGKPHSGRRPADPEPYQRHEVERIVREWRRAYRNLYGA